METTKFDEFLKTIKKGFEEIPEPINKKVRIYRGLMRDLNDAKADDKEWLTEMIGKLEEEILNDLQDEYEHQLEDDDFQVDEKEYQQSLHEAYDVLVQFIPRLSKYLSGKQQALSIEADSSKITVRRHPKETDSYRITLAQELEKESKGRKPEIEFEIVINTKKKTAMAVERILVDFYYAIYGKDGFNHWPDDDLTYFYYVMTLSLIDWLNDLMVNDVVFNLDKAMPQDIDNESVLSGLFKKKQTKGLKRSYLKSLGLKTNFNKWEIPIGIYTLERDAIFKLSFNLGVKMTKVQSHGSFYNLYNGTQLYQFPILKSGNFDLSNGTVVTESPKKHQKEHLEALISLGVKDRSRQAQIVSNIKYY